MPYNISGSIWIESANLIYLWGSVDEADQAIFVCSIVCCGRDILCFHSRRYSMGCYLPRESEADCYRSGAHS